MMGKTMSSLDARNGRPTGHPAERSKNREKKIRPLATERNGISTLAGLTFYDLLAIFTARLVLSRASLPFP